MHAFEFDVEILGEKEDVGRLGYDPNYLTQISRCRDIKLSSEMIDVKEMEQTFSENEDTVIPRRSYYLLVYKPRWARVKNVGFNQANQSESEKYMYPPWHYLKGNDTKCTTCDYFAAWAWAKS